jgi:hypothetical protein
MIQLPSVGKTFRSRHGELVPAIDDVGLDVGRSAGPDRRPGGSAADGHHGRRHFLT